MYSGGVVRSLPRLLAAATALSLLAAAGFVVTAAPAWAAGELSATVVAPADLPASGPVDVTGTVANVGATDSEPVRLRLRLDASAVAPAVTADSVSGTCDVPGASSITATVQAASGIVELTCPTQLVVSASGTQLYTFHLALAAPASATGTVNVVTSVLDAGGVVLATSSPDPATLHPATGLNVSDPGSVGTAPVAFGGSLDNTGGAAQPSARLTVVLTSAGGMEALLPSQVAGTCDTPGSGGPVARPASGTLAGAGRIRVQCPDFALAADQVSPLAFTIRVDPAAPSGTLKLQVLLEQVAGDGSSTPPPLAASTPAFPSVLPPPSVTSTPPVRLATGAEPRTFGASATVPATARDLADGALGLVLGGLANLASSQVTATCDTGSGPKALGGWVLSAGTISALCPDHVALHPGTTVPATFTLALDPSASSGTLTVAARVADGVTGTQLAVEPAHPVGVSAGRTTPPGADCQRTVLWNGPNGGAWGTAGNWDSNAVPTATDTVVLPIASSVSGATGPVCNLVVNGGADAASTTTLTGTGTLAVVHDTSASGFSALGADPGAAFVLSTAGVLSTSSSTDLTLRDGQLSLPVPGTATWGAGSRLHRQANPSGAAPTIPVSGVVQVAGTVVVDQVRLLVAPTGGLDVRGATLQLTGPASSSLSDGSRVLDTSQSGGGVLSLSGGAELILDGRPTLSGTAVLRPGAGSLLTAGPAGAVLDAATGSPVLDWQGGTISGALTLGPALRTRSTAASDQVLAAGAVLTNTGTMSLDPSTGGGSYDLRGTLVNRGVLTLRPSVVVTRTSGSGDALVNEAGATLGLEPPATGAQPSTVPAVIAAPVRNRGVLSLPLGMLLRQRGPLVLESGSLVGGGAPSTGSTLPPGTLAVGAGGSVQLTGTTTLDQQAVLALDDTPAPTPAPVLVGGPAAALVAPAGAASATGALHLCSGSVSGGLSVAAPLVTEVGPGAVTGSCRTDAAAALSLVGGSASAPATLRTTGPTSVNNATVTLAPYGRLVLAGSSTFGGAAAVVRSGSVLEGQQLVVEKGASLAMPSLQLPGLFTTTRPSVSVPVVSDGAVVVDSALVVDAPLTSNGSLTVRTPLTVTGLLTTTGSVELQGTTLRAQGGYTQVKAEGAAADAAPAVTQLDDAASTLTTSDGATPASLQPVTIADGGLVGGGTVQASQVTVGSAFLRPSPFNNGTPATMTVDAPLTLAPPSDVQVIVYAAGHDLVKVTGATTVSGTFTTFTGTGYTPAYLATVTGVMSFASHTADFTDAKWGGTPVGLGWRPKPLTATATAVDVQLVDVASPAVGIASFPAFTQFTSQRFTYSAVDNRTGVKSYDVRWQQASPTSGFGAWTMPTRWQNTTATSQTLPGLTMGRTYCFSVRARDKAGNVSPWSKGLCTARMLDDRGLSASAGWTRPGGQAGYYGATFSRTSRVNAVLKRAGTFTRVAFTAVKCKGCGNVLVYSGSTRIGGLSLNGSRTTTVSWVSPVLTSRTAVLTLKVTTNGRPVTIDAVGFAR